MWRGAKGQHVDDARKDASRQGCPRPTDLGLHPKAGSSASGAAFRPGSAAFGVLSERKRAFEKPILAQHHLEFAQEGAGDREDRSGSHPHDHQHQAALLVQGSSVMRTAPMREASVPWRCPPYSSLDPLARAVRADVNPSHRKRAACRCAAGQGLRRSPHTKPIVWCHPGDHHDHRHHLLAGSVHGRRGLRYAPDEAALNPAPRDGRGLPVLTSGPASS